MFKQLSAFDMSEIANFIIIVTISEHAQKHCSIFDNGARTMNNKQFKNIKIK